MSGYLIFDLGGHELAAPLAEVHRMHLWPGRGERLGPGPSGIGAATIYHHHLCAPRAQRLQGAQALRQGGKPIASRT